MAPGSKNFISNLPPDMRSMSLEKRTPDGPRCVSELANALGIFQRTRSWALAAVAISVSAAADAPSDSRFEQAFRHMAVLPSSPKDVGAGRRRTCTARRLRAAGLATAQIVGALFVLLSCRSLHGTTDSSLSVRRNWGFPNHDTVWRFLRREGRSFKKTLFAAEQRRPDVVRRCANAGDARAATSILRGSCSSMRPGSRPIWPRSAAGAPGERLVEVCARWALAHADVSLQPSGSTL